MAGNIVSSTQTFSAQKDGSRQVHEVHTDVVGLTHTVDYLAGASDNLAANLAVHATNLGTQLQAAEIQSNLGAVLTQGAGAVPVNHYSTVAQNIAAFLLAYPGLAPAQAVMAADFLVAQSDAVLEAAYGMSAGDVANLRALPTLAAQVAAMGAIFASIQGGH